MKINRLDAHDRLQHFTKQQFDIGECCQDLIAKRPFGDHAFYIFAHTRTDEDGVTKRLIWQPRLTKPKAQTNSMLFKVKPGSDNVRVIWMIPAPEMWKNFQSDQLTANETILKSINDFRYNREKLEEREADDLTDAQIDEIYRDISLNAQFRQELQADS